MIRDALPAEADYLAELWFSGWQDAHANILPLKLAQLRTLASFREHMREHLPDIRVAESDSDPLGFVMFKGDELYQFYVGAAARGTGVAAELMQDAEAVMKARGVDTAWLACAIGNDRAARFYAKRGWQHVGNTVLDLPMPDGSVFRLEVWRFEKRLA